MPRVLRATIILGAGLSAIYGEFIPRSGGRPARMDALTVSILVAVGLSLLLMFSKPLEPWKARYPWLRTLASMGIAPGFFAGALAGWAVGELHFDDFAAYNGPLVFWPDFSGLVSNYSVLGLGLPGLTAFAHALPLALVAYLVGFTDIITGTAILQDAAVDRPDEPIPFDTRRTHLSLGLRNSGIALIGGPARILDLAQAAEFGIDLLARLLANVAGIKNDHVGAVRRFGRSIAKRRQNIRHARGVIDVHLTTVSSNEQLF